MELAAREAVAARLAQALANPARLRILALLREEGAYLMHLTNMLAALRRTSRSISRSCETLDWSRMNGRE